MVCPLQRRFLITLHLNIKIYTPALVIKIMKWIKLGMSHSFERGLRAILLYLNDIINAIHKLNSGKSGGNGGLQTN